MKHKNGILTAFLLNLVFSFLELFGGIYTGSAAIISDAVHDFGDALSIGLSLIFEKISKRAPDSKYTYGYARYSALGAFITHGIMILSSAAVIVNAVYRLLHPGELNSGGMLIFAVFGLAANLAAFFATKGGGSLGGRAVNLHMLEDVLGWGAVLVGAAIIRLTGLAVIDPILSILVAVFILVEALRSIGDVLALFLDKSTVTGITCEQVEQAALECKGVVEVHHVHLRSFDGINHCASLHIVFCGDDWEGVKREVKSRISELGVSHVTVECEKEGTQCDDLRHRSEGIGRAHSHHTHSHSHSR